MRKLKTKSELDALCQSFRISLLNMLYKSQSGHPGSSLSMCEVLTTLYYNILNVDPQNPQWENRDRLVLSKGHASPMLYIVMANLAFFNKEELNHLRKINHMLQGHPHAQRIPGVDYTAGPLGLGLSFACGIAAGSRLAGKDYYTYAIMGDGEMQEGCVWEALHSISKFKFTNLITIIDNNGVQLDGTNKQIMPVHDLRQTIASLGYNVIEADGHDTDDIQRAVGEAKASKEKPSVIFAKTVKGKGVSFMEGQSFWHGAEIDLDTYTKAMFELGGAVNV